MSKKIVFCGGGQLALMMSWEAMRIGVTPYVITDNRDSPAAKNLRDEQVLVISWSSYSIQEVIEWLPKDAVATHEWENFFSMRWRHECIIQGTTQ